MHRTLRGVLGRLSSAVNGRLEGGGGGDYQGRVCRSPRGNDMLQGTFRPDLGGGNDMAPHLGGGE